jgi:hypothetical protein
MNILTNKESKRTTVSAREEYLFNVASWPGQVIDMSFVLKRRSRSVSFVQLVTMSATGGFVCVGSLGVCGLWLGFPASAKEWDELDTMFVKR